MSFSFPFCPPRYLLLGLMALAPVSAFAQATGTTALGDNSAATGDSSTAVGQWALSSGSFSSAFGQNASASGYGTAAVGSSAQAAGYRAAALGYGANADADACVALGSSSACGGRTQTVAVGNAGIGYFRQLTGVAAGTLDSDAVTVGQLSGYVSSLGGGASFAGGTFKAPTYNLSTGSYSDVGSALTALDGKASGGGAPPFIASSEADLATAQGDAVLGRGNNLAVGSGAASGSGLNQHNVAIGGGAQAGLTGDITDATGGQATAIGANTQATNLSSTALGYSAVSSGRYSTAIGSFAVADEDHTVSFGSRGQPGFLDNTARLVYVAPGIGGTDAMNMNQGNAIASWYGAGAAQINGTSIAPMFELSGGMFRDVNSALVYLDNKAGAGDGTGAPGPQGPQGPQGNPGPASGHDDAAIHYDTRADGSVDTTNATLQGQGGTTIHNLHAGVAVDDAANVGQVQQSLSDARSYSDAGDQRTLNAANDWAKSYTDGQIRGLEKTLNRRIAQAGAVGTVFGSMALSSGGVEQNDRLSMGVASYRGESAVGVSMVHKFEGNNRVSVSLGAAFAGSGGTAIGASVSIGLGK